MLRLIEGGFHSGGREMIKQKIHERTEKGQRSYLIVPEQQTVSAERELTDLLPPSYPLVCEATNFTRLSDTVFRNLGGLAGIGTDSLHRALIIFRTLSELSPILKTFGTGAITTGTVNKTMEAIRKMQSLSVSAQDLSLCADALSKQGGGRLPEKLRDLSEIISLYERILTEDYHSAEDTLIKAARKLSKSSHNIFSDTEFFIEGFTSFTEPQYTLMLELMRCADVTVYLTIPRASGDAFEYTELRASRKRLVEIARLAKVDTKPERIDGAFGVNSLLLSELSTNIWRTNAEIDKDSLQNKDILRIVEAENPYEECDFVAADIKRRVMLGESYSDFAVVARNIGSYSGIITPAFEKAGIPLFVSQSEEVDRFELIKLIFSAISAVISGFSRADVISYAKCSLSGISTDEVDELELYCERWQIDKKRFTDEVDWNMNPDGLTSRKSKRIGEKLTHINETRRKTVEPLLELAEGITGSRTVSEMATALVEFLVRRDCESRLSDAAAELRRMGRTRDAEDTERIFSVLCKTLDVTVEVLGKRSCDAEGFLNILRLAFAEMSIGQIPSFTEQVVAGSADTARFYGKKHIYIIGANSGIFPARVSEAGFFGDSELKELHDAGLKNLEPELSKKSAMEYYYFSRVLSFAEETLTLCYTNQDAGFGATRKSEAIERILKMLGDESKVIKQAELSAFERTYTPSYALEHLNTDGESRRVLSAALSERGYSSLLSLSEAPIRNVTLKLDGHSVSLLYPGPMALTQSRLDSFVSCPLRHFLSYTLRLDEGKRAEWGSNNIGTFIHAVLEGFFRTLKEDKTAVASLSAEDRIELTRAAAKKYAESCFADGAMRSARVDLLIDRLSRYALPIVDSLCDEFSNSKFQPIFFELGIDRDNPASASPATFKASDGRDVYVYGTIDRVDSYESGDDVYLRVVDYKTGSKTFSPNDLEKGENLQMFLYLKALVETENDEFKKSVGVKDNGKLIPAGVIYVKADIDDVTVSGTGENAEDLIKAKQARLGMLLDDRESIAAMNPDFIPIKFTSKTDENGNRKVHGSYKNRLYTSDGWDKLNEVIASAIKNICDGMLSGDISAEPMKKGGKGKACQYCAFKPICRNSNVFK